MNKTLYIKDEDDESWQQAGRYLKFHEGKSLSEYLNEHVKQVVAKYETAPPVPSERKRKTRG